MKYYAQYNTADPRIGAVSVGEVLADWQVQALGPEKIAELTAGGLLKAVREADGENSPEAPGHDGAEDKDEEPGTQHAPEETGEDDEADDAGEDDGESGEDDGLDAPDSLDDIVDAQPEKPNKRGRGKKTDEGKDSENRQD